MAPLVETTMSLDKTHDSPLTQDAFLGGRLTLLQPKKGFRAGTDSVFVAASVPCQPGEQVFEAGIGAGVAALCLAYRVPNIYITGVERSELYMLLARKNAVLNNFPNNIQIISGDVKEALNKALDRWPQHGSFAHAFANPPFFEAGKVLEPKEALTAEARVFSPNDLLIWVKVLYAMVMPRGTATFILPSSSLKEVLDAMEGRFGGIKILPIHPYQDQNATRIIVQGIKQSKASPTLLPSFIVHKKGGNFTEEAEKILREGKAMGAFIHRETCL